MNFVNKTKVEFNFGGKLIENQTLKVDGFLCVKFHLTITPKKIGEKFHQTRSKHTVL